MAAQTLLNLGDQGRSSGSRRQHQPSNIAAFFTAPQEPWRSRQSTTTAATVSSLNHRTSHQDRVREESGISDQCEVSDQESGHHSESSDQDNHESGHQSESSDQGSMCDFIVNDVEPGTRLDWREAIAETHRTDRAAETQWLTDAADAISLDSTVRALGQKEMRAEGEQEEDPDSDDAANFVVDDVDDSDEGVPLPKKKRTRKRKGKGK
jgi:hypothetical protein